MLEFAGTAKDLGRAAWPAMQFSAIEVEKAARLIIHRDPLNA
jgi:hypothetical protein